MNGLFAEKRRKFDDEDTSRRAQKNIGLDSALEPFSIQSLFVSLVVACFSGGGRV